MGIRLTRQGSVATLTLDSKATLNALDDHLVENTIESLTTVFADPAATAVILTGDNGVFSAGGNLQVLRQLNQRLQDDPNFANQAAQSIRHSARIIELLRTAPIPTIAAIDGACAGAAIGWVAACDLRVGSEAAFFDTAYLKLGLSSDFGVGYLLRDTVGPAIAKDWLLRPRRISATEAYRHGFITEIYPTRDALIEGAAEIAAFFHEAHRMGVQAIRDNIAEANSGMPLADHLEAESQRFIAALRQSSTGATIQHLTS